MSRPWILVCPASRGLGRAVARQVLLRTRAGVVATVRGGVDGKEEEEGEGEGEEVRRGLLAGAGPGAEARLAVVAGVDVTEEASVAAAAAAAQRRFPTTTHHLALAVVGPGVLHAETAARRVDADAALASFRVHALGPLLLFKWFAPFLPRKSTSVAAVDDDDDDDDDSDNDAAPPNHHHHHRLRLPPHAVWLSISARVGSISDNKTGGWYSYRSSKAALNSLTKSFDIELRARCGDKAMAIAYHPGTVRTQLSRAYWGSVPSEKLFEPELAAEKLVDVATARVGLQGRGRIWDWKGDEIMP